MLDGLACRCEGDGCERTLDDGDCMLVFRTDAGERRAYECPCGHVTVTVVG